MGNPRFWASVAPKSLKQSSYRLKIWLGWLRRQSDNRCQKWYKSAQQGRRGKRVKYNVQLGYFFTFLAKLWRTHFWDYRCILCTGWCVSVGIDFLGGSQRSSFIFFSFNPHKTANFRPIFGLGKITTENA